MRKIGYARVSTDGQDTALQIAALQAAGCGQIYEEKASGASRRGRPVLEHCLGLLGGGDVLVVYRIDRIARSLSDLLAILDHLKFVGAQVKSLNEPLDTTTPMGVFTVQVLGAVAQLERAIILERTNAGLQAAKARGVRLGQPPRFSLDDATKMRQLLDDGTFLKDVAALYSCHPHTIRNTLRRFGLRHRVS